MSLEKTYYSKKSILRFIQNHIKQDNSPNSIVETLVPLHKFKRAKLCFTGIVKEEFMQTMNRSMVQLHLGFPRIKGEICRLART